jgi:spermidine/putrescine transport system ATP-binding protein
MGQDVAIIDAGIRFDGFWAVRHIDVHIEKGEFFSFLGPSGCGKTTLLRLISGFLEPSEGQIRINGKDMRGIGPNKRNTSLIFQNLALFPLMSVSENIGFGLEIRRVSKKERNKKVAELLELVDLPGSGEKKVNELSGGQKQRVAIARALAVEPSVLMLDEPLSALDLKLRQHMRAELRKIQQQTGVTFIYITHDQTEALTMSDRIGVMSRGRIEQLGSPAVIYNTPSSPFVASFVGENNQFQGKVQTVNGTTALLDSEAGPLHGRNPFKLQPGEPAVAFLRPESISFDNKDAPCTNSLGCRIVKWSFEGAYITMVVRTGVDKKITVRLNNSGSSLDLQEDKKVTISFDPGNFLLLADREREGV